MVSLLLLGSLVGLVLGLTGAGGGVLAVPALMVSQGWSVTQAAPVGILAVTGSAWMGVIEGLIRRLVRYRAAIWMALTALPMTALGLHAAQVWPVRVLQVGFALVMVIVALRLLFSLQPEEHLHTVSLNPNTGRIRWNVPTAIVLALIGMLSGFLTGLLGVGGGFVLIPALSRVSDISMHGIVATSLSVVALVGSSSVIMLLAQGYPFPWAIAIPFLSAAIIGMLGGRMLARRWPVHLVQRGFAVFVLLVAISMLYRAL